MRHAHLTRVLVGVAFVVGACATADPNPTTSPTGTAAPAATPIAPSLTDRWTRIDMPDPAPGVYGGGTPSSIVRFGDGYVAAGTVITDCCDGGDPASHRGILWTSADGRSWVLHDPIDEFAHSTIGLMTDDTRLIAVGTYVLPGKDERVPAVWTSTDGSKWARTAGKAPSFVAVGPQGLLGAVIEETADGSSSVTFVTSADGLAWTATSRAVDLDLRGLAAAADGTALAVGAVPGPPRVDGSPTTDLVIYGSTDGTSWAGPKILAHDAIPTWLTNDGAGFLALINVDSPLPNGSTSTASQLWRFDAGLHPVVESIPATGEEPLDRVWAVGDVVIASGYTIVDEVTNAMLLVSIDGGGTWGRVLYQDAFGGRENEVSDIVPVPGGLLAVGRRWDDATMHPVPEAWIATR